MDLPSQNWLIGIRKMVKIEVYFEEDTVDEQTMIFVRLRSAEREIKEKNLKHVVAKTSYHVGTNSRNEEYERIRF